MHDPHKPVLSEILYNNIKFQFLKWRHGVRVYLLRNNIMECYYNYTGERVLPVTITCCMIEWKYEHVRTLLLNNQLFLCYTIQRVVGNFCPTTGQREILVKQSHTML